LVKFVGFSARTTSIHDKGGPDDGKIQDKAVLAMPRR
jgi:hypothetical protein